ncbi:MAG: hypothetical protein ABI457_07580 [Hyphomicrobium sp.]
MDASSLIESLAGQTILIADRQKPDSICVKTLLKEAGAKVVIADDERQAVLAANAADLTAAVLDVEAWPGARNLICWCLDRRSIPFLFLGEDSSSAVTQWAPAPTLSRSTDARVLVDAVINILVTDGYTVDRLPTNMARAGAIYTKLEKRILRQEERVHRLQCTGRPRRAAEELLRLMRRGLDTMQNLRPPWPGILRPIDEQAARAERA